MRLALRLILAAVLAAAAFLGWMAWFAFNQVSLVSTPLEFDVRTGLSLRVVARQIADAGVGFAPWQFSLLGRIVGRAGDIKAGSYEIKAEITPWELLGKLTRGDVTQAEIVFVEGKTFHQLRSVLDADPNLRHDTMGLGAEEILVRIGAAEAHPEGLFFPDTYLFVKQSSDLDVLRRAYRAMQRRLNTEWENRDPAVPYENPYQALIMASIVEKETGRPADRADVAAVFTNRLRLGMLLQTDPTVIYGLGDAFDGNLRKRDLLADVPYNTYTRGGLPPTPITMPGMASIQVVMHPLVTDKLYFVARGDGSSAFSRTLEEHNRAVAKYQKKAGGR
jgi:UPF0755 protein